jgi:hypothetical protein
MISILAFSTKLSGKKSLFPMMIPNVIIMSYE